MNIFICLLGPSLLGTVFYEHITKKELSTKKFVINFMIFTLVVNTISTVLARMLLGAVNGIDGLLETFPIFAVKYIVIATVVACVFAILFKIVTTNVEVSLETKTRGKKNEKNN